MRFGRLTALSEVEGPFDKPFDRLTVDAEQGRSIEGLRYPYPSSLQRTSMYASFLRICPRFAWTPHPAGGSPGSEALHLDIFHQPHKRRFFDSLVIVSQRFMIRNRATKAIFPKGKESYRGFFVLDEIQLEGDPTYPSFPP
ncbi:MAG: hypothetical protein AMK69_10330 [Nitrospira bacterium SG8_3]|nr:MAG: hypothetical protein AMK69_10330 [Nitrospira bacterium SG8_3]